MRNILLAFTSIVCIGIILSVSRPLTAQSGKALGNEIPSLQDQVKKDSTMKVVYTCSMHPEVMQTKAGKCPKCGMNLTAKTLSMKTYICPMHPEVVADKAGKCPKCGMNLVLKEPAKEKKSL